MWEVFKDWFHLHYAVLKDFSGPAVAIVGFIITSIFAALGLRTFSGWKREKIEEARIEIALKGLALAYESTIVFDEIRAPLRNEYEWDDMASEPETVERRGLRGSHYAVLKRIDERKDFFERVWATQPSFMAVFGPETEEIFSKLHSARRWIEVSAGALMDEVRIELNPADKEGRALRMQMRRDTSCSRGEAGREGDRVGALVLEFRKGIEKLARPVVDHTFGNTIGAP